MLCDTLEVADAGELGEEEWGVAAVETRDLEKTTLRNISETGPEEGRIFSGDLSEEPGLSQWVGRHSMEQDRLIWIRTWTITTMKRLGIIITTSTDLITQCELREAGSTGRDLKHSIMSTLKEEEDRVLADPEVADEEAVVMVSEEGLLTILKMGNASRSQNSPMLNRLTLVIVILLTLKKELGVLSELS